MKIDGNALRPGHLIQHQGRLWIVVKTQHTQPGKGGAYMQVVLKGVKDGTKMDERFRAGESVERVRLDEAVYQFLFEEQGLLTLMDQATYEQITVPKELLGEPGVFLQEGMLLTVSSFDEEIVSVTLPDTVVMEVVEADPVVKGQTASASYKPARLENGARVMVPPHIGTGTRIIVNTQDSTYVERAK
ncbi:MAG: elongation factor P [Alphaproteobacteria bacterium]